MKNDDGSYGLPFFHCYDNWSLQPNNTCGQAVIASIVDAHRAGHKREASDTLAEVVKKFGPNWPFKNGVTNRQTIKRALRHYGIPFREFFAKPLGDRAKQLDRLMDFLRVERSPVIVLLDVHALGLGKKFMLHWAIAYAYTRTHIRLATWGKSIEVPWSEFTDAWKCWFLPPPYRYYQIQILPPKQT